MTSLRFLALTSRLIMSSWSLSTPPQEATLLMCSSLGQPEMRVFAASRVSRGLLPRWKRFRWRKGLQDTSADRKESCRGWYTWATDGEEDQHLVYSQLLKATGED